MEYTIVDRKLIICDGTIEIGYRDICNVIAKNEIDEIYLPATIKVIHDDTFSDWADISRINIPKGIQHIGSQAFWGLDELEELTLPISVSFVGKHAFCNCRKLILTVIGSDGDVPSGWDSEFVANIKEVCFRK